MILIKEIGGVSNRAWPEKHSREQGQLEALSVSFLKQFRSSNPGLQKPVMFMEAQVYDCK